MRMERHECQNGTERWSVHVTADIPQHLIISAGAIRVWTVKDGDLEMPPCDLYADKGDHNAQRGRDIPHETVFIVEPGKPFCVAPLMKNTVFYYAC